MEETTRTEETMNTTEVTTPVNNDYIPTTSSGKLTLTKVVIVGAVSAVAGAAAFGLKKLKQRNKKKMIEQLKKEGYTIVEPEDEAEEEYVEAEVDLEEDIPEEESK